MTATRQISIRIIATDNASELLELAAISEFDTCDSCGLHAAELFNRTDGAGDDVAVCEHCADTLCFGLTDCD